jgi:hypothetical protein
MKIKQKLITASNRPAFDAAVNESLNQGAKVVAGTMAISMSICAYTDTSFAPNIGLKHLKENNSYAVVVEFPVE